MKDCIELYCEKTSVFLIKTKEKDKLYLSNSIIIDKNSSSITIVSPFVLKKEGNFFYKEKGNPEVNEEVEIKKIYVPTWFEFSKSFSSLFPTVFFDDIEYYKKIIFSSLTKNS